MARPVRSKDLAGPFQRVNPMNQTTNPRLFWGVVITFFLALGVLVFAFLPSGKDASTPAGTFAAKPTYTVVLKPIKSGEALRVVATASDGSRQYMRIEFQDGRTAIVDFDKGGKPVSLKEFYALSPAEQEAQARADKRRQSAPDADLATRKLSRLVEFAEDGKTIKSERSYRMSGSIKEMAVLSVEGDLVATSYYDNRSGIERIKVYAKKERGRLISEQVFRPDGTGLAEILTVSGYNETTRDFFDAKGVRYRSIVYGGWATEVVDYLADGKTRKMSTNYGYSSITVTSYDEKSGKAYMEKTFYDSSDAVLVTYYDISNKNTYSRSTQLLQRWVKLDPTVPADRVGVTVDGYVLEQAIEYYDSYNARREVNFYPGGKVVKMTESRKSGASWGTYTRRHYRIDGSLERTEEYQSGQVKSTVTAPSGNSERESVEAVVKTTPIAPVLKKTDEGAPKPEFKSLSINLD